MNLYVGAGVQAKTEITLRGRFLGALLVLLASLAGLQACSLNRKMTVGATASLLESVAAASQRQSDLRLVRDGMPSYLMLLDGMVAAWPENERLLLGAAQAYSSFASVFSEDPAYEKQLYWKATRYALSALERRGFVDARSAVFSDFEGALAAQGKEEVPYLFWAASCWGNWIALNLDSMEAVAELPRVEAMMKRVLALDESFYYGGPHIFMGVWHAVRPQVAGGDLDRSRMHFQRAMELGRGKFLMTPVYYAATYARKAFDRKLYVSMLEAVIETRADIEPDLILLNTAAHKRAEEMLKKVDEYF